MFKVKNIENVWGSLEDIYGDAKKLNGSINGLYGYIGGLSGNCSGIAGPASLIETFSENLDDIQKLIKDFNLVRITFSGYMIEKGTDYTYSRDFDFITPVSATSITVHRSIFTIAGTFCINNQVFSKLQLLRELIEGNF